MGCAIFVKQELGRVLGHCAHGVVHYNLPVSCLLCIAVWILFLYYCTNVLTISLYTIGMEMAATRKPFRVRLGCVNFDRPLETMYTYDVAKRFFAFVRLKSITFRTVHCICDY